MAQITKRATTGGDVRYDVRTRIGGRVVTKTFKRRKDADTWATTVEADKLRGVVIDPRRAKITVREYSNRWLAGRSDLAERTVVLYRSVLDRHVLPTLGGQSLGSVTPSAVRAWNSRLASIHPPTAAKAYRLLSTIMRTAVADEVIIRNPCQVKGAGRERAPERPIASVAEVGALSDAMPAHMRVAILLAAWCQLRRGEVLGLRRMDLDLMRCTLTVAVTRGPTMGGRDIVKAPKTEAGLRTIAIPKHLLSTLQQHLDTYVDPEPESPVLVGEKGGPLRAHVLQLEWDRARRLVGRRDLRLHDLRHSGLTWSAATGATVAELMHRAGHASPTAALRYQHATADRDRALADALADLAPEAPIVELRPRDGRAMAEVRAHEGKEKVPLEQAR